MRIVLAPGTIFAMRSTNLQYLVGLVAVVALVVAACGSDSSDEADGTEAGSISVTDATGAVIELDSPATRVACVHELCTDMMSSLGVLPIAGLP